MQGQSFGCFLTPGILCKLREANDYVGKNLQGMGGGEMVVAPVECTR